MGGVLYIAIAGVVWGLRTATTTNRTSSDYKTKPVVAAVRPAMDDEDVVHGSA